MKAYIDVNTSGAVGKSGKLSTENKSTFKKSIMGLRIGIDYDIEMTFLSCRPHT